jgi:hypothetical protein
MSGAQLNADGRLGLMLTELRLPTIKRLAVSCAINPIVKAGRRVSCWKRLLEQEMNERDVQALRAASDRFGPQPGQAPFEL